MRINKTKTAVIILAGLAFVSLLESCGKNHGTEQEGVVRDDPNSNLKLNSNPTPPPAASSNQFSLSLSKNQVQMNLGKSDKISVPITVKAGVTGVLDLVVDRSALDSGLQANNDIAISLSSAKIILDGVKTSYSAEATVTSTLHAPSFQSTLDKASGDQGHFRVKATLSGGSEASEVIVPLMISPVVEVKLMDGNHTWDPPNSAFPLSLRTHAQGVTFRFMNYDSTMDHVIHGNGLIPHQGAQVPTQPQILTKAASAGAAGGVYEISLTAARIAANSGKIGSFYCHAHAAQDAVSGKTAVKTFMFNK